MIFVSYMMIFFGHTTEKNEFLLAAALLGLQDQNAEKETTLMVILESQTKLKYIRGEM